MLHLLLIVQMGRCLIRLTMTILEEVYSRYHVFNSIQLNFIYVTHNNSHLKAHNMGR